MTDLTPEFLSLAPKAMYDLRRAFNMKPEDAAAIVGNAGHESGGFKYYHQIGMDPNNPACGLGWFQWSGARHVAFKNYCELHGYAPMSPEASMHYLISELMGIYHYVLPPLQKAKTLYDKVAAFEKYYEAAGVPAISSRFLWADKALRLPVSVYGIIYDPEKEVSS